MSTQQLEQEAEDIAFDIYGEEAPANSGQADGGEKEQEANASETEPANQDGQFGVIEKEEIMKQRK